jgi:hypothetical protein
VLSASVIGDCGRLVWGDLTELFDVGRLYLFLCSASAMASNRLNGARRHIRRLTGLCLPFFGACSFARAASSEVGSSDDVEEYPLELSSSSS